MAARPIAALVDFAAMVAVGAAVWFWWNPLMRYLPNGFADDVDAVILWAGLAEETSSRGALRWIGNIEWVVGAVAVVLLLWLAEKLVGAARRLVRLGSAAG